MLHVILSLSVSMLSPSKTLCEVVGFIHMIALYGEHKCGVFCKTTHVIDEIKPSLYVRVSRSAVSYHAADLKQISIVYAIYLPRVKFLYE
jgi:hypothetical protein